MFRRIIDRIKEAVEYLMSSRLIVLIIVFCLTSSILIGRLFYLQIVRGEDYLENYGRRKYGKNIESHFILRSSFLE